MVISATPASGYMAAHAAAMQPPTLWPKAMKGSISSAARSKGKYSHASSWMKRTT
jgi:hypothetical protein